MAGVDVLVVSVETTTGWKAAARELASSLQRAGASVAVAGTGDVARVRTFMLTDLVEARAARAAASRGIAAQDPRAVIYCSMTASLLWPRPGAIWLDSIAAENRPGRHGLWQRVVERRRLAQSPLVLAMSEPSVELVKGRASEIAVVPTPVEPSGDPRGPRDIPAITYASGDPKKRRLELVLDAWQRARRGEERLVVAGIERLPEAIGLDDLKGVELAGKLDPRVYRDLLRRARVFVAAPRREDYGIAPLEALADGCVLVTTPATGPYPALTLARTLDPRLVTDDLAQAIRAALDDPVADYPSRAARLLEPFSRATVDATLAQRVLPRLLDQRRE